MVSAYLAISLEVDTCGWWVVVYCLRRVYLVIVFLVVYCLMRVNLAIVFLEGYYRGRWEVVYLFGKVFLALSSSLEVYSCE